MGSSPMAPSRMVSTGDRCTIPDHGLVTVESFRDGIFIVKCRDRSTQKVQAEVMRAPADEKFAWTAGTKVAYQSASLHGKWIDANVVSFNPSNRTYNLDVRMDAAPDKVRPR